MYRQRRNIIRRTWGSLTSCEQVRATNNVKIRRLRWKLVFVLGKTGPETNDDKLNAEEAKQHNDLLIGNIDDNYVNLIIKCYMAQLWASTFNAKYTLKADDDVYMFMYQKSLNIWAMRTSKVILMEVTPAVRRNLSIDLIIHRGVKGKRL